MFPQGYTPHEEEVALALPEIVKPTIDVVRYHGYSIEAKKTAEMISIVDDIEAGLAVDARSKIKTYRKEAEADRKDKKAPFLDMGKRIDNVYNGIVETFDQADAIIATKLLHFQSEKLRVQREAAEKQQREYQERIAKEQAQAKKEKREAEIVAPPPVILPPDTTIRGSQGASTFKKFWNYRITDINALYKARPDLVKMEEKRREVLEAIKADQKIPGLEIFEDMTSSGR